MLFIESVFTETKASCTVPSRNQPHSRNSSFLSSVHPEPFDASNVPQHTQGGIGAICARPQTECLSRALTGCFAFSPFPFPPLAPFPSSPFEKLAGLVPGSLLNQLGGPRQAGGTSR